MFRFSLRELSIAALAVALGIAWFAEHNRLIAAQSQCHALKIQVKEVTHEAEDAKKAEKHAKRAEDVVRDGRKKDIELISQQLAKHELQLLWFCCGNGSYPSISKRSSDSN